MEAVSNLRAAIMYIYRAKPDSFTDLSFQTEFTDICWFLFFFCTFRQSSSGSFCSFSEVTMSYDFTSYLKLQSDKTNSICRDRKYCYSSIPKSLLTSASVKQKKPFHSFSSNLMLWAGSGWEGGIMGGWYHDWQTKAKSMLFLKTRIFPCNQALRPHAKSVLTTKTDLFIYFLNAFQSRDISLSKYNGYPLKHVKQRFLL